MPKRRGPTARGPKAVELVEKESRAVELRKNGWTFGQIAAELGYANESGAWHAVNRVLIRTRESTAIDAGELREIEVQRCDRYTRELHEQLDDPEETTEQKRKAIETALRVSKRRSELLGLDAPTRVEIGTVDPIAIFERMQDWEAIDRIADEHADPMAVLMERIESGAWVPKQLPGGES